METREEMKNRFREGFIRMMFQMRAMAICEGTLQPRQGADNLAKDAEAYAEYQTSLRYNQK